MRLYVSFFSYELKLNTWEHRDVTGSVGQALSSSILPHKPSPVLVSVSVSLMTHLHRKALLQTLH